jgi:translocation and assembly module TamB
LAVTGPFVDPQLFGETTLDGGSVTLSMLASPIEDLRARVTFSSRRVVVEDVSARVAGGTIHGSGEAALERRSLDHWGIQVRAEHLSFVPADGLAFTLSADTRIEGRREQRLPTVTGDVLLERLIYSRPIELGATLEELTRTERADVVTWRPSEEHVTLDLRVREDQPLVVRNNLIDAELRIDEGDRPLRIVGTDQRFGVLGDTRFERGRIFFRNNAFEIRPGGSVVFDDDTQINPRFDVHAVAAMRRSSDIGEASWRILLDVTGTSDSLHLATRSDPELPQEDILLLLAVGMTRAEVEAQAGDVGSTAALEALASVTGVDREVRRALPVIDDFRLGSAYSARTARTEPQITIGKRIADRIRLSATTGLSEARDFRALIEAQLDDTTSVTVGYDNYNLTSGASFGNFGADLRWRLEFE